MLPAFALLLSPVDPLPVEFVAGGDGRPDAVETALGLSGGSGRSGMLSSLGSLGVNDPRNIADKGRLEEEEMRWRGVITASATGHQPQRGEEKKGSRRRRAQRAKRMGNDELDAEHESNSR